MNDTAPSMRPVPALSGCARAMTLAAVLATALPGATAWAARPARAPSATTVLHVDVALKLEVSDAWIRWLPGDLPAGGYVTIVNRSDQPIVLVGATSPDYAGVQLHRSVVQGGQSSMQPVARITIPAHASLNFAAQGYHLMLTKARAPIAPGDHVPIELHFASGGSLSASFEVRKPDATPGMGSMPGMPGMSH